MGVKPHNSAPSNLQNLYQDLLTLIKTILGFCSFKGKILPSTFSIFGFLTKDIPSVDVYDCPSVTTVYIGLTTRVRVVLIYLVYHPYIRMLKQAEQHNGKRIPFY